MASAVAFPPGITGFGNSTLIILSYPVSFSHSGHLNVMVWGSTMKNSADWNDTFRSMFSPIIISSASHALQIWKIQPKLILYSQWMRWKTVWLVLFRRLTLTFGYPASKFGKNRKRQFMAFEFSLLRRQSRDISLDFKQFIKVGNANHRGRSRAFLLVPDRINSISEVSPGMSKTAHHPNVRR